MRTADLASARRIRNYARGVAPIFCWLELTPLVPSAGDAKRPRHVARDKKKKLKRVGIQYACKAVAAATKPNRLSAFRLPLPDGGKGRGGWGSKKTYD